MRTTMHRLVVGLCFALASLRVASAWAETPAAQADPRAEPTNPQARAHYEMGAKLFGIQNFEEAIEEYKQGALIESLPVWDLALGQCYRMLHRYQDALWYFDRFVKHGHPSGKLLKGITDITSLMRAELDKKAMTQEPMEVTPGSAERRAPASTSSVAPATAPVPPARNDSGSVPWYRDALGLTVLGVGTVTLGAACYFALDGHRLYDLSNTDPSQMRRNELHDQYVSRYELSAAFGIAGAAGIVVGIVRLATRPSAARITTAWNVGVTRDGVMVFGRF